MLGLLGLLASPKWRNQAVGYDYVQASRDFAIRLKGEVVPPPAPGIAAETLPGPAPEKWDWLVYMPADRFRAGRYLVRLHSEILGEDIALVSGPGQVARAKALGLTAYLPEEIERLAANPVDAAGLRKLHSVKKRFGGTLTGPGTAG